MASDLPANRKRGRELLELIRKHGPISIEMLCRMTSPKMEKRSLRKALPLLRRKGLIELIHADPHTAYYQLSPAPPALKRVAQILERSSMTYERQILRRQDRFHNQWCEYWAYSIERLFPDIEIIRDRDVEKSEYAKHVLQISKNEAEVYPDLLFRLPQSEGFEEIAIAFEIERTRKSKDRLLRKLKRFSDETLIDGLVYVCEGSSISDLIHDLYFDGARSKSERVRHYGSNFFLFTDRLDAGGPNLRRLFNANAEEVSFQSWFNVLRSTHSTLRRDTMFC